MTIFLELAQPRTCFVVYLGADPSRDPGTLRHCIMESRGHSPLEPTPPPGGLITEAYVRQVGRFAYFWAWPMVNLHNRCLLAQRCPEPGLVGGIVPVAPLNSLCMLCDYIAPQQRFVACPNQDVVYGFGILSLAQEPVIIQVPDLGERFWVYQLCDQRTDAFGMLGTMYGSEPGFYLLAGP